MKYEKKPTTFEEQAEKLLSRGLVADREELLQRLNAVSYYRLSGYLYPFRQPDSEKYREGTDLKVIWNRYCFDRRLRVLVLDAIERIEVSARTKLVSSLFPCSWTVRLSRRPEFATPQNRRIFGMEDKFGGRNSQKQGDLQKHFFDTYGDCHKELPVWMLAEVMSMGATLTFFRGVDPDIKRNVAGEYGLADELFFSWFRSLNAARNISILEP